MEMDTTRKDISMANIKETLTYAKKKIQKFFVTSQDVTKEDDDAGLYSYDKESPPLCLYTLSDFINLYSFHWLIYSAIYAIITSISQIPIKIKNDKGELIEKTDPLYLFFQRPNEVDTWGDLLEKTFLFLETTGNSLWEKVRDNKGKISKLYTIRTDRIKLLYKKPQNYLQGYEYTGTDGKTIFLSVDDVLHHRYTSSLDYWGVSSLAPLTPTLLIDIFSDGYLRQYFEQATILSGVLETDSEISEKTLKRLELAWKKFYTGLSKAHKTPILDQGLKFKPISAKISELNVEGIEKSIIKKILAAIEVPPVVVGILEGATYANAQFQYKIFWKSLVKKANKIAEKINVFLLPEMGYEGYSLEFDFSEVKALKEDAKTQAQIDEIYIKTKVKLPNEVRKELGLPPLENGNVFPVLEKDKNTDKIQKSEERLVVERFIKNSVKGERKFANTVVKSFRKIENLIKEQLQTIFQKKDITLIEDYRKQMKKILESEIKEVYQIAIYKGAQLAIEEVQNLQIQKQQRIIFDYDFDALDPVTLQWIETHVMKFSDYVTDTTIKQLQATLKEGFEKSETMKEISERVSAVFEGTVRATAPRAMLIARTEIIKASNYGKLRAYQGMKVPEKQWVASIGAYTPPRPAHARAHRQIVKINEKFFVGGEYLEYPGDPTASPGNICRCRCTMRAIVEEWQREVYQEQT
jgi:HK97 family phage portal protein